MPSEQDTELKEPNREADRWLKQAESDLAYAELGLRERFFAQVCFQCQQVCEKAIKALRYGRGERAVLGHALVELAAPLEAMARFRENLAVLDQYYVPTRYPNGLPGGIPSDVYTGSQATKAVEIAREVVAAVGADWDREQTIARQARRRTAMRKGVPVDQNKVTPIA